MFYFASFFVIKSEPFKFCIVQHCKTTNLFTLLQTVIKTSSPFFFLILFILSLLATVHFLFCMCNGKKDDRSSA